MDSFSKRNNYSSPQKGIIVREDAPRELREFIVQTLYSFNHAPSFLRRIFCRVLRKSPDNNNWTEFPNIETEAQDLINECEWFKVYNIIEAIYQQISQKQQFTDELNDFFKEFGIGWKLENGQILFRGDEFFEIDLQKAIDIMEEAELATARNEIKESIKDLSRKPNPDLTGAIQHSLASLECIAREITGDKTKTLGAVISNNRGIVPAPLDKAIDSIWHFSSEQGRHLREGREPSYEETELLVGLSASIGTYLARKSDKFKAENNKEDELPDFL